MARTSKQDAVASAASDSGSASTAAAALAAAVASDGAASAGVAAAAAAVPLAAAVKQTRASLSLHEKSIVKSFCEQRVDESKARGEVVPSQDLLRREVQSKFGWEMGRSTLSKVMTMDWKALSPGVNRNPNMKRKRKPLFPDFEADLVKYIGAHIALHEARAAAAGEMATVAAAAAGSSAMLPACLADGKPEHLTMAGVGGGKLAALQGKRTFVLTEAVILEEAQRLKKAHGIKDEELVLSVGWLARFKHRNGIRLRKGASGKQQVPLLAQASLMATSELLYEGIDSGVSVPAVAAGVSAIDSVTAPPSSFLEPPAPKPDPVAALRAPAIAAPSDEDGRAGCFKVARVSDQPAARRRRASL